MTLEPCSERQDLHAFLHAYRSEHPDDVMVMSEHVRDGQDLTALVFELARRGRDPMLVAEHVGEPGTTVVTNMFASRTRVARLLGASVDQLHQTYQASAAGAVPVEVLETGPVFDQVTSGPAVDLTDLPLLTHFASDRAPYITSGIIVAEGEQPGTGNLSYHRSMVHSRTELATSLHSRGHLWRLLQAASDAGRPLPVAMVVGGHPLFMLAASARVGFGVDERQIAGGLFGEPLQVVRTPGYGIGVPATADLVLEGTIDAAAYAEEGPFGEFSGYSSDRSTNNVLHVETVLRRDDLILADVVGGNSDEHLNLARIPRESEMAQKLMDRFPDVLAVHYPNSGVHFHAYVALRQGRPGQARQVLLGLLGWDPYLKTAIAVDDDIDLTDDAHVLWAMATHVQPHRDLITIDGLPGSPLDPSSSATGATSRLGIDATRGAEFHGNKIQFSTDATARARQLLDTADRVADSTKTTQPSQEGPRE